MRRFFHFARALLLLSLAGSCGCNSRSRPLRIGSVAPDFVLEDVRLSKFRGQVVVLNFWATWCAPCVRELPSLIEMQRRLKAKKITVIAISVDVDEAAYQQFVKDHNVTLVTVRDPSQKISAIYGTFKFPETYVIDRNGVLQRKFLGAVDWTGLQVIDLLDKV